MCGLHSHTISQDRAKHKIRGAVVMSYSSYLGSSDGLPPEEQRCLQPREGFFPICCPIDPTATTWLQHSSWCPVHLWESCSVAVGLWPSEKNVSTIYSCFISNASSWGDVFLGPGASSDVVINGSATTKGGFKACRSTLGLGVNYVFVLSLC